MSDLHYSLNKIIFTGSNRKVLQFRDVHLKKLCHTFVHSYNLTDRDISERPLNKLLYVCVGFLCSSGNSQSKWRMWS